MYIIAEIGLKTCVLELGLESYDRLLNVVNYVVNACFWVVLDVVLHIGPVNIFVIHFGCSGDQNWVRKFVSFCTAQMMLRLSEMIFA